MFLIVISSLLAITHRSFWLDECITAQIAAQPTLGEAWRSMLQLPEVQLPFFMFYMWICTHAFHAGEWMLRAAALPWFWAGAGIFIMGAGRVTGSALIPSTLLACSGFAWYYLNEARVYSYQLGCCLAVVGSAAMLVHAGSLGAMHRSAWRLFLLSLVCLCGTSILGAMWGAFFFLGLFALIPRAQWSSLFRLCPWVLGMSACLLLGLAGYYVWTLTLHAKPTPGATTLQTIIFVFYEISGAAGLGPGRNELRSGGISQLKPFVLPITAFALLGMLLWWQGVKELWLRCGRRRACFVLASFALPFLVLCILGKVTELRVLGRHATPLLALFILLSSFGVARLTRTRSMVYKLAIGLFLLLSLASCFSLRFAHRHKKDDYRGAAAIARSAAAVGKNVWWSADESGAAYYGVSLGRVLAGGGRVSLVANQSKQYLAELAAPHVIIASKPDIFDNGGGLASYAKEKSYRRDNTLPAFSVWTRND